MFASQIFYIYMGVIILVAGAGLFLYFFSKIKAKRNIFDSLDLVLYEVTLPRQEEQKSGEGASFKDLISVMEQFYTGMRSMFEDGWIGGRAFFSLELALPSFEDNAIFYVAIPKRRVGLFEKQLTSLFPNARAEPVPEDYNIFNYEGESSGAYIKLENNFALSIKNYKKLDTDPLEVIINTLSKLQKEGEGAGIQIVISKPAKSHFEKIKEAMKTIREGRQLSSQKQSSGKIFVDIVSEIMGQNRPTGDKDVHRTVDEDIFKLVEEKSQFALFNVNIRVAVSALSKERADTILSEISGAFLQFSEPRGNGFDFIEVPKSRLNKFLYEYSFRIFNPKHSVVLNARELTSIYHFPVAQIRSPKLKILRAKDAHPPQNLPKEGVLLGINNYRKEETEIRFARDDRRRHFYIVGQTGTGKTSFLENIARQDIANGEGVCVIDPHGDMALSLLGHIPENRIGDVIYFDAGDISRPLGLNFMEYNPAYPEQKTFIVNEFLNIFRQLYGDVPESLGPVFEQYFRNATLLVLEDTEEKNTILDISRVLSNKEFRDKKLARSKNMVVNSFWRDVAEKAGGESALANIVPYITSKFDNFLTNEFMRPILLQKDSSFDFRKVMDERKILIVNLSKGKIGEMNANLLGLLMVGKLFMSALSRVDIHENERADFYLYLDEFQNITTKSIASILSEARKFRLDMVLAHQFIGQLTDEIKKAVFGNVGSIASFRLGTEDAEFVAKQFEPVFSAKDLMNIENFKAYIKLLINGETSTPFDLKVLPPKKGNETAASTLKELSSQKYGKPNAEIEAEINAKYQT